MRQDQENHAQQQLDEQEQQQFISQALEEFGRLSAEHHDQDKERRQQQAAQENPEAVIDDHENDPQHPPGGDPDQGPPDGDGDGDGGPNQPNPPQLHLPEGGRPYTEPVEPHSLGHMNVECHHCRALHFMTEKLSNSSARNPCFGLCCLQGQVSLPPIQRWPHTLQDLYDSADF